MYVTLYITIAVTLSLSLIIYLDDFNPGAAGMHRKTRQTVLDHSRILLQPDERRGFSSSTRRPFYHDK